ncbi:MAG: lysozyme inhibitor LprI family protein [Zoogloeaceae bacterium]|nr:lysozyme inhibitor LprI family protein [Zoogloeaceae bacterium]
MKTAFFLSLLIAVFPFAAQAERSSQSELSSQFEACTEKAEDMDDWFSCADAETERQDKRLNRAYQSRLNTQGTNNNKKSLQEAPRAWVKYRDANCELYYFEASGSGSIRAHDSARVCVLAMTKMRADELELKGVEIHMGSQQFNVCIKTEKVDDCFDAETELQNQRLNRSYESLLNTPDAESKKSLQNAQRTWFKYRDANCLFYLASHSSASQDECLQSMTAKRAEELEDVSFNRFLRD